MYETRKELIKKMHDLCEDLNECEVELESKKEPNDINRRLDRLEECVAAIGNRLRDPGDMLLKNITDIYEEQAAAKGDQDE